MLSKSILLVAVASFMPAVFGQTSSTCNPLQGCRRDNPALGTTFNHDFRSDKSLGSEFEVLNSGARISFQDDGMHMRVGQTHDAPLIQSKFYIFWGKLEVVMKAGPGAGVVSSVVLQSDNLDEIDLEWLGSQPDNVQTNIFSKGNQNDHSNGGNHGVANAVGQFHTYTTDWTPEAIIWSIDGNPIRTLTRASLGDKYPQTPMQVRLGPWAGGDPETNAEGTVQWAGGPINYSQGPFDMVIASVVVTDYTTGATVYRYGDNSGSSDSIQITRGGTGTGAVSSRSSSAVSTSTSATAAPSSSSSASSAAGATSSNVSTSSVAPSSSAAPTSSQPATSAAASSSAATSTSAAGPASSASSAAAGTSVVTSATGTSGPGGVGSVGVSAQSTPTTFVVVPGNSTSSVETSLPAPTAIIGTSSASVVRAASPLLIAVAAVFALL